VNNLTIIQGDCREMLKTLPEASVQCCVTSPPYFGLRDYGCAGQIGLETSPAEYVVAMVEVFREVWRVLRDDGTLWLNLGDSYANDGKWGGHTGGKHVKALHCSPIGRNKRYTGLKPKDLIGIPWMVAFALRDAGWYLRSDIVWSKLNPMPESVTDRPTKSHEYIFLLTKAQRYFYDAAAIQEPYSKNTLPRMERGVGENHKHTNGAPGQSPHTLSQPRLHSKYCGQATKDYALAGAQNPSDTKRRIEESILNGAGGANKRSVWTVANAPFSGSHFATFPPDLIKPCILAGTKPGDAVLDPFGGSGTTGMVALELARKAILIELNPEYAAMADQRCNVTPGLAIA
jgi:DNA modification methylase